MTKLKDKKFKIKTRHATGQTTVGTMEYTFDEASLRKSKLDKAFPEERHEIVVVGHEYD